MGLKLRSMAMLLLIISIMAFIFGNNVYAAESDNLYLNKLDFYVKVNSDGSMRVIETWNIDIRDTNTLYKTFEMDKKRFSSFEDVTVRDVTNNRAFTQIDEEMYHVTKDCYYGLQKSNGDFEIAWGVGLDDSYDTRTYEISYTVTDAIGKYNDYAELYWQFVGEDFEISASEVTGTIILPESAKNIEDIKVWGHTEELNGEIYVTGKNEISFQIDNFNAGHYIEVRSLFPTDMIQSTRREYAEDRYNTVLQEETNWANQANLRRTWDSIKDKVIIVFIIFVVIAIIIIFIQKAVKYGKKLGELKKYIPEQKLDYFRELPEKNTTPGEAVYILEEPYNKFTSYFGKILSATLLDLKLKKYIDLKTEKDQKGKDKIIISRLRQPDDNLKEDEKTILKFICNIDKKEEEITVTMLEKYISDHYSSVEKLIKQSEKDIEKQLEKENIYNKKQKEEYLNYSGLAGMYYVFAILTLIIILWAFPLAIVFLINGILCSSVKKNINVLTQKGINDKEKWKGLKKYMEDFSLLNEKEVPAIEVWEQYLVYATAFGIADKVLKQLKTVYPNIDELDNINSSAYMYFIYHSNFSSSISNSISSSISSAYSSSSGGGGGFSGGGGGGRRPEVAVEEGNILY